LKRQDPKVISVKTKLMDLMNESMSFFVDKLNSRLIGGQARQYLKERGLTDETLKEWQVGWAVDEWEGLGQYLRSKGFSDSQILSGGMAVKKPAGGYYDRFRGRIMFPICNTHGDVVGFTGRVLVETEKSGGKYVNTSQTQIYDKSRVIFGLDKAKQEIRKKDLAVVVEGQMDVIASHQAGVANVIASSGTALTRQQVELLSRYTKNLAFCFDADSAGEQATRRGIDLALELGMNVKVIQIEGAKDPDECIKERGAEIWQGYIDSAVLIMKYYFDLVFGKIDVSNVEGKREAARQLLGEIAKLSDRIEQDYWVKQLGERIGVDERILRESVKKIETRRSYSNTSQPKADQPLAGNDNKKGRREVLGERIVGIGMKFPETLEVWIKNLDVDILGENQLISLAKKLIMYYNQSNSKDKNLEEFPNKFDYNEFKNDLSSELQGYADVLVMLAEKEFGDLDLEDIKNEVQSLMTNLRKESVISQLKGIEADLKKAEGEGDKHRAQEFSEKLSELVGELGEIG